MNGTFQDDGNAELASINKPESNWFFCLHVYLRRYLAKLEIRVVPQEPVDRFDSKKALESPSWTRSDFICSVKRLPVQIIPL